MPHLMQANIKKLLVPSPKRKTIPHKVIGSCSVIQHGSWCFCHLPESPPKSLKSVEELYIIEYWRLISYNEWVRILT